MTGLELRAVALGMRHGVDRDRLSALGLGDTSPVADNTSEEGRSLNRRVELVKQ